MIRPSPASFSACAFWTRAAPFVVSVRSRAGDLRQHLDEALDVAADERLAAGQPDLLDAQAGEDPREAGDLLERQEVASGEEGVVAPVDLLRHAVDATEVAAVRDRDTEVAQRPVECVFERHGHTLASPGDRSAHVMDSPRNPN